MILITNEMIVTSNHKLGLLISDRLGKGFVPHDKIWITAISQGAGSPGFGDYFNISMAAEHMCGDLSLLIAGEVDDDKQA